MENEKELLRWDLNSRTIIIPRRQLLYPLSYQGWALSKQYKARAAISNSIEENQGNHFEPFQILRNKRFSGGTHTHDTTAC